LKRRDVFSNQFTFSNSAEFKRDYFPLKHLLDWRNHIVGVRLYGPWARFQFILSDNSISKFADSKCNDNKLWVDHKIEVGSTISKVEMMILRSDNQLFGLKFY
jgi:hypothetical protein